MQVSKCRICGDEIKRGGSRAGVFCSLSCKAKYQVESKGISKEWLYQKYMVEQLGCYEIAKLVHRNPKRVYEWLIGYDIPPRTHTESLVLLNKREDIRRKRQISSASRTASDATRRKISVARKGREFPNLRGERNGMFGRKGKESPNWKGGATPERQAFYSTQEWKDCVRVVRGRAKGRCERCKVQSCKGLQFDIHHIVSFAVRELRSEPTNLILLCYDCHKWVHSKNNKEKELIKEYAI